MAASRGHLEVVKFLKGKGAKVSDEQLIEQALREEMDTESIKLLQYILLTATQDIIWQKVRPSCSS